MSSVLIKWIKVDESNFDSMEELNGPGLYMYTIKDLNDSPFYVGTAGESKDSSLCKRLKDNEEGFSRGERTFLRRSVIDKNKGKSLSIVWDRDVLYIPGTHRIDSAADEGEDFHKGLNKYFCKIDVPDDSNGRDYLRAAEAFVQNEIREIYKDENRHINFFINQKSLLLGQTNSKDLERSKSMTFVFSEDTMSDWFRKNFAIKK